MTTTIKHIKALIDSLTQRQYDKLMELVQCNVDGDNMVSDVQEALRDQPPGTTITDVRVGDETWLFTQSEDEIVALLKRLKTECTAFPVESPADLQALIRTKDEWAAREHADAKYELDVSDCDDVVGTYDEGLTDGIYLAELLVENGSPDCKIFKLTLDQYDDDDVVTYWVGTHAQVKQRLEWLATDPRHEG